MKNLFFVAVATGIFSGTSITTSAQANINIEKLAGHSTPTNNHPTLKFIDGIEIMPEKISDVDATSIEPVKNDFAVPTTVTVSPSIVNIETCSTLQFKYAMMMDIDVEAVSNLELYSFIEEWWGTRYRYGGTTKKGIDCSSFTGKLLTQVYGLDVQRTARDQFGQCEKVAREDLQEGDLVFFNTRGGVSHVGVYLGNDFFVHSSTHSGVTISSLTDNYYNRKFIGGGRLINR